MLFFLFFCGLQIAASLRQRSAKSNQLAFATSNADEIIQVIDFADPKANMQQKLRAMKTPQYKKLWPKSCTGENRMGSNVSITFSGKFVDGFKCLETFQKTAEIPHPIAPTWYPDSLDEGNICCQGMCEHARYSKCAGLDLSQAALKVVESMDTLVVGGEKVEVVHSTNITEQDRAAGVSHQIALKIPETLVSFVREEAILTPEGEENLRHIIEQIGALLSMMQTANSGAGLLACPHGSTTACWRKSDGKGRDCHIIGKNLRSLPHDRAAVVASELKKSIEGIQVGDSFGHLRYERQSDFPGGRFGAVIVKAYNRTASTTPDCNFEDLYNFVDMDKSKAPACEDRSDTSKFGNNCEESKPYCKYTGINWSNPPMTNAQACPVTCDACGKARTRRKNRFGRRNGRRNF